MFCTHCGQGFIPWPLDEKLEAIGMDPCCPLCRLSMAQSMVQGKMNAQLESLEWGE